MSDVEIRRLDDPLSLMAADDLAASLGLGITHSTRYRTMLQLLLGCEDRSLGAFAGDELVGFLPLMCQPGPWGAVYNSLPFAGSDGGAVSADPAVVLRLGTAYETATRGALARVAIPSPLLQFEPHYPHVLAETTTGQFTDLVAPDDLWQRVEQRAQTAVRSARRHGVEVHIGRGSADDRNWLEQAHAETMFGLGVEPKPPRFFELLDLFESEALVAVAEVEGVRVAGVLLFVFGTTVDYYLTANTPLGRSTQAMSLLVFNCMCELADRGARLWNWGSYMAGQEGVARFKRQWGVFERPYRYLVDARLGVLERTAAELAANYPGFFVYPYRLLAEAEATPDEASASPS